jgi:hypothetical protein
MSVYVRSAAIYGQTAGDLQLNDDSCHFAADGSDNYFYSVDLTDSEWDDCGVTRSLVGGGTGIKYETAVKRWSGRAGLVGGGISTEREEEQHNGVIVTREKCFMMTARCYYNADGTASAEFYPSAPNTLVEYDTNALDFNLYPITCGNRGPTAGPISVQTVFVKEEVCFRAEIADNTDWHDNIRLSIRRCWASDDNTWTSSGQSPAPGFYYPLGAAVNEGDSDATFSWDCHAQDGSGNPDPIREDFSFDAFRFQQSSYNDNTVNYAQTIYVICEVNACEIDDFTSDECTPKADCVDFTNDRRQRRDTLHPGLGQMSRTVVAGRLNVLPKPAEKRELYSYNLLADSLAMGMFAVGCVLAVVAVGLLIVLRKTRAQIRYGRV